MNKIIISTTKERSELIVNNSQLGKIERLKNWGGFRRFELSIVDDKLQTSKSDYGYALAILAIQVFGTDVNTLKAAISPKTKNAFI